MSPEVERQLLDFITEGKTEKVTLRDHLKTNTSAMQKIFHQLELHEQKDDTRHQQITEAFRGTHARLEKLERDAEDTGKHNIEELKARLAEAQQAERDRKATKTTWSITWVHVAVTVLVAVCSGVTAFVMSMLLRGGK